LILKNNNMPPIKHKHKSTISRTVDVKGPNSMGRSGTMLPEVTVTAKRTPKAPMALKTIPRDSTKTFPKVAMSTVAKDSTKAPEKKMNRLKTAVSDYTSAVRSGANIALSGVKKEVPGMKAKTTAGKAIERGMRVAGGVGATVGLGSATYMGLGPAAVVAGQALYNKRDEASKKRGLLNVGKNLDNTIGQLSSSPDSTKKQVRNSAPLANTQFND
jgi:hypothetical protein